MITIHTLASGSEGNAALVCADGLHILVDAGISARRIENALKSLGRPAQELSAIFITHTHSDHTAGLRVLSKHTRAPIFASPAVCAALLRQMPHSAGLLRPMCPRDTRVLGPLTVTAFATSHDSAGSMDYRFDCGGASAGILTDTGFVTPEAEAALAGVELLLLESNHDIQRLHNGSYPYPLKQRILSDCGHLSNDAAAEFACRMAAAGTRRFVLVHLSRENNTPALALDAMACALRSGGYDAAVTVAPRGECSEAYIAEGAPCRK